LGVWLLPRPRGLSRPPGYVPDPEADQCGWSDDCCMDAVVTCLLGRN